MQGSPGELTITGARQRAAWLQGAGVRGVLVTHIRGHREPRGVTPSGHGGGGPLGSGPAERYDYFNPD